jgi:hypothetical protein
LPLEQNRVFEPRKRPADYLALRCHGRERLPKA